MLNKKQSKKYAFAKSILVLPLLGFFLWSFNVKEEVKVIDVQNTQKFTIQNDTVISSISDLKITYDKNTTKEQLESDKKFLKEEYDVEMNYSNVSYNSQGELTSLTIEIIDLKNISTSVASLNASENKIFIHNYKDKEGKEIFFVGEVSKSKSTPQKATSTSISEALHKSKKIVFNGKKQRLNKLKNTTILVKSQSIEDGLVYINGEKVESLKDEMTGDQAKNFIKIDNDAKASVISFSGVKTKFTEKEIITKEINASETKNETNVNSFSQKEPLYYVNKEKITAKEMELIDPNTIKSINVLKDKKAIEKYGEEGKHGVIEITLNTEEEQLSANNNAEVSNDYKSFLDKNPLILLNEKETDRKTIESLDSNKIKSVFIFKAEKGVEKYGEKAKNGALIIYTK